MGMHVVYMDRSAQGRLARLQDARGDMGCTAATDGAEGSVNPLCPQVGAHGLPLDVYDFTMTLVTRLCRN